MAGTRSDERSEVAKREGETYYNVDVHYRSNKSKFGNLAFSETDLEEPEAVFKACEFILTQLNKEDIS